MPSDELRLCFLDRDRRDHPTSPEEALKRRGVDAMKVEWSLEIRRVGGYGFPVRPTQKRS